MIPPGKSTCSLENEVPGSSFPLTIAFSVISSASLRKVNRKGLIVAANVAGKIMYDTFVHFF